MGFARHSPSWSRLGVTLDVLLVVGLVVGWAVSWLSARSLMASLPRGSRAFTLAFWSTSEPLWGAMIACGLCTAALVARHWFPVSAFIATAVLVIAFSWFWPLVASAQFSSALMLVITAFWAMWRCSTKARFVGLAAITVAASALTSIRFYAITDRLAAQGATSRPGLESASRTLMLVALAAIAVAAAWLIRRFDRQGAELADRNVELQRQRAASERAAVVDERIRISRELHDVVAHHVTTMTVHAGAARQIAATNPEGAASSLQQIEQSGREAVVELQRLLGVLRGGDEVDDADRSPVPSLRHIERLAGSVGGVECALSVTGDRDRVPQSVDVSAYRIVQEALTNVMKHASTDQATVVIDVGEAAVTVEVADQGAVSGRGFSPGTGAEPGAFHGGHGIVGMRERVALHGGGIEVGPSPDRGWIVRARLPYNGAPQHNRDRPRRGRSDE